MKEFLRTILKHPSVQPAGLTPEQCKLFEQVDHVQKKGSEITIYFKWRPANSWVIPAIKALYENAKISERTEEQGRFLPVSVRSLEARAFELAYATYSGKNV